MFLSDVILDDKERALPAICTLRDGPSGNFGCSWTITTYQDPRRISIGLAEVTQAQLAVIEADPRIRVLELTPGWKARDFDQFDITKRQKFIEKADSLGLSLGFGIIAERVIDDLGSQIRQGRLLVHIEDELEANHGVAPI